MLVEIQHRIANSLQIIASIILLKAKMVDSEETRVHLHDAHKRVMSIAAVQQQLHASGVVGPIEMVPYLSRLCHALATSMIGDRPVTIKVAGEGGSATSRQAESLGLIATELVMNALKHAFPANKIDGRIIIAYDVDGTNWKLSVADNGIGKPDGVFAQPKTGLGTGIVNALARQLDASVETSASPEGTTVSKCHFLDYCVRTCDGYYFPLSSMGTIVEDTDACQAACPGTRTEVYERKGSDEIEDAVSLKGNPYSSLATAFSYRSRLTPTCSCKVERKRGFAAFFEDATLVQGDIVVTEKGVYVFAGANRFPYRESDFVPLSKARGMPRKIETYLAEIDRLVR